MRHLATIALVLALNVLLGRIAWAQEAKPETPATEKTPLEREKPLAVGETAPNFRLQDQNKVEHTLDGLLKEHDHVALVFYRSADW